MQSNFGIGLCSIFLSDLANIKCTRHRKKLLGDLSEYWRSEICTLQCGINEFISLLTTFLPDLGAVPYKESAHNVTDTM